jgi:ribonuclease HII
MPARVPSLHRIGVDENGLGAQLGPLVVTGVLALVDERGTRTLSRRLPKALRADLDDSKRLVSHADVSLGEAWARVLSDERASSPDALLDQLLLEDRPARTAPCPSHVAPQCWSESSETFTADEKLCDRVRAHRRALALRGVTLVAVRSSVWCTKRLNEARARGINRFVADLHAMEGVLLNLRKQAGSNVDCVCGKVGGIGAYGKFFGPLSNHLHTVLDEGHARSSYYFPTVGEVAFVRDADAADPLVMLASLVGKYLRELLMARVARFYPTAFDSEAPPSGYHDPITQAFVDRTALARRRQKIPNTCFVRDRDPVETSKPERAAPRPA